MQSRCHSIDTPTNLKFMSFRFRPEPSIMNMLIQLARENAAKGGYPIGAAIVKNSNVIATGLTTILEDIDPTAHAEMNAIRTATKGLRQRYLEDCYLYTIYEPCPMCSTAAIWAKLAGIVYGACSEDETSKYPWRAAIPCRTVLDHSSPKLDLHSEFMRKECMELLNL